MPRNVVASLNSVECTAFCLHTLDDNKNIDAIQVMMSSCFIKCINISLLELLKIILKFL